MPVEKNATFSFFFFFVVWIYADVCLHNWCFSIYLLFYNKKKLYESNSKLNVFWIFHCLPL